MISKVNAHILIIDDDEYVLTSAKLLVKQYYQTVSTLANPTNIISFLTHNTVDVILLDMNYRRGVNDGIEGLNWLKRIKEFDDTITVIPMTAYADIDLAVAAVKKGAADFVTKPWQNDKLLATIGSAFQLKKSKQEISILKAQRKEIEKEVSQSFNTFIGECEPIKAIKQTVGQIAATDATILITGENGTGKEVVARAIHNSSIRSKGPFISIDLGAIPDSLFESELFGHKKGAFTDAKTDKIGRFSLANGGTLFLDEIGNLSSNAQSKLLGVLQTLKITAVGAQNHEDLDVRIIAATNTNLPQRMLNNSFRTDLFYRLNTVEIQLPPLRDRKADIALLADYFLELYCKKYHKTNLNLSKADYLKLREYNWPGNIRELQHVIERTVILSKNSIELMWPGNQLNTTISNDNLNLETIEKETIIKALEKYKGNISQTAKALGLTRTALYRRLEKHGI